LRPLCSSYERENSRLGCRSGYYKRSLETSFGPLLLKLSRDREGLFRTSVFDHYKRRRKEVENLIRETFLAGVSTRKVGEIL